MIHLFAIGSNWYDWAVATIVFMGSASFSVPSLRVLARHHCLSGVVTQPDRPAGRGRKLSPSEVKSDALTLGLSVITPSDLGESQCMAQIRAWKPDVIVVVAFGRILGPEILSLPKHGCLNVHASLLPRHRGASPIAAAIQSGDTESGVTLMKMVRGLDKGPLIAHYATPILDNHTAGSLTDTLAILGSQLLHDQLGPYLAGDTTPVPQDESLATYAPMLKKADGRLLFTIPAMLLARQVRAMNPWPGAFAVRDGRMLKILEARAIDGRAPPGKIVRFDDDVVVGTSAGLLRLDRIQPSGGRPMSVDEYVSGASDFISSILE